MIKRIKDMQSELKENMRGGKGTIEIQSIFTPEEFKGNSRLIAKIKVNPGCSIGMHEHDDEEEIYYVIRGEATLTDSTLDKEVILKPGDASLTLGGQSHAIRNDGQEVLEFIAIILLY